MRLLGHKYIKSTRDYLDYLEEHLNNIAKAFVEVSKKCEGMPWVGDDKTWFDIRSDVLRHDLSKFSKEEFTQYRDEFCPTDISQLDENQVRNNFGKAWENHKEMNHHHHETAMTENDIVHMVVDWQAMSYKFGDTPLDYYNSKKDSIKLSKEHTRFLEEILNKL